MTKRTLEGSTIVITGASSGIGATLALALAPRHVNLVLAARRIEKLEQVAQQVRAAGSAALVMACDVGQREQVQALVATATEKFSRLDVMVANAGFGFLAPLERTTDAQMEEIIRVNVLGTWYAMAESIPVMRRQGSGHLVLISSAAARRGLPLMGPYAMTKAAQLSLAEAARAELAHTGIYVSSVHPISTATEFFDTASQRSRMPVGGMGHTQTAQFVARKIVRLLERPRPELWPFGPARFGLAVAALWPGLADYFMARSPLARSGRGEKPEK